MKSPKLDKLFMKVSNKLLADHSLIEFRVHQLNFEIIFNFSLLFKSCFSTNFVNDSYKFLEFRKKFKQTINNFLLKFIYLHFPLVNLIQWILLRNISYFSLNFLRSGKLNFLVRHREWKFLAQDSRECLPLNASLEISDIISTTACPHTVIPT